MKFAYYPNRSVVLTFESGYSLHPSAKHAAAWLRQCADDVEAHGEAAAKSPFFEEFEKAWEAAGMPPPK